MSCKYCTDEEDNNRSAKFGCETGDRFYSDKSHLECFIESGSDYGYLGFTNFRDVDDGIEIKFCPFCGKKLGVD